MRGGVRRPRPFKARTSFVNRARDRRYIRAGWYTAVDWINVCARHGWRCIDCGIPAYKEPLTIGHAIPLAHPAGTNWPHNLIPQCLSCNDKQGTNVHRIAA